MVKTLMIVTLLTTSSASAADPYGPPAPSRLRSAVIDTAWIGGAAVADIWTTELVLRQGGREANPLMRGGLSARIGVKLAVTGFGVAWADHERKRGNNHRAKVVRWTFVAAQLAFAAWNLRQAR